MKTDIPYIREKLERFLGMVNYLSKFASNLAEITSPLRSSEKETVFIWNEPQTRGRAFEKVKEIITQSPVLCYFDPKETLTLEVDASKVGLGVCLMQRGRLIAFASKS